MTAPLDETVDLTIKQCRLEVEGQIREFQIKVETGQIGELALDVITDEVQKRLEARMMQHLGRTAFRLGMNAITMLGFVLIGLGFWISDWFGKLPLPWTK